MEALRASYCPEKSNAKIAYPGFLKPIVFAILTILVACAETHTNKTEILWDTWGVPHIYGEDIPSTFYAFGWAQMASHGNLILHLYGRARGLGAEYWGGAYLNSDRWIHTMDVHKRAQRWYELQSPEFRVYLDSFAAGINAYSYEHLDLIADSVEVVLPVSGVDILAHVQHMMHIRFFAGNSSIQLAQQHFSQKGSNAWAIGPDHTEAGNALLLANPHLGWSDYTRLYEAHLRAPGLDLYGCTVVGFPVLAIAFNEQLGWSHTVNMMNANNMYELTLEDGGYRFDGKLKDFEEQKVIIRILEDDGTMREEEQVTRWSVHGPVIAEQGESAVALRAVGFDAPGLLKQWWDMGLAQNLAEFETALRQQQLPIFSVIYADRDGHILHHFGGRVPIRSGGNFYDWNSRVIPGDSSQTLWTDIHSYDALPRVLDPPSGWLQNANDAPWTTTFPKALNPQDFSANITGPPNFWARGQRSSRMLSEDEKISFDELVEYKHSTRMELADLILDDLVLAAREHGSPLAQQAADVLETWDRSANAESRGAVLFFAWAKEVNSDLRGSKGSPAPLFSTPWSFEAPFKTPDGLADPVKAAQALDTAARKIQADFGALDVPWGDVYRLRGNDFDLPANGAGGPLGVFRVTGYQRDDDGVFVAQGGDTYVAAVEFADPVRARVLLTYGNATQPHSHHLWDQLELYAKKELREAWLTKAEIEAHLELREIILPLDSH